VADGWSIYPLAGEQLSNVVDEKVKHQAATSSSVVVVSSSPDLDPVLNFTPGISFVGLDQGAAPPHGIGAQHDPRGAALGCAASVLLKRPRN